MSDSSTYEVKRQQNLLRGNVHALLALKWEIRAHQRRVIEDAGDAHYCEIKADAEAARAEKEITP